MDKTQKPMRHGIVIPCYNEAKQLNVNEFLTFIKSAKDYEICFVNDGSKDDTLAILNKIKRAANTENLYIYDIPKNKGKAEAVRQGCKFLYEQTNLDTIGFLDADLSTSFQEYTELSRTLEQSDQNLKLVFGSRILNIEERKRNPIRNVHSFIVRAMISCLIKVKIADTQCGAKVFSREIIPTLFHRRFTSKWLFEIEIVFRLKRNIGTVSLMHSFREQVLKSRTHRENFKLSTRDLFMIPVNLLKLWSAYELKPVLSVISHVAYSWSSLLTSSKPPKYTPSLKTVNDEPYYNIKVAV